jgi:2-phosphosulfolactate phosphatase
MHHARLAARIVLGSFLNLSAVVASVKDEPRIDILCAGTDGQETFEDFLVAGAIVDGIHESNDDCWIVNNAAQAARDEWQLLPFVADAAGHTLIEQLALELRDTRGGKNLVHIGLNQDVVDCAQIDRLDVVPEIEVRTWRIAVSSD